MGGNLSSLIHLWTKNNRTYPFAYFIQGVKSCVVIELDEITTCLVDTLKIIGFVRYKRAMYV